MKTLTQYINEAKTNTPINYQPKFSVADWEKLIKKYPAEFEKYSQLWDFDTEFTVDLRYGFLEDDQLEYLVQYLKDFKGSDKQVAEDIAMFLASHYAQQLFSYVDNEDKINKIKRKIFNNPQPLDWGIEEDDYFRYICPKKNFSGDKEYAKVLAKRGGQGMEVH